MSLARLAIALVVVCCAGAAGAADDGPSALSARLAHIKQTGVVRLGFREDVVPFSFTGADGRPMGYSIDLCRAIVQTLARDVDVPALAVEFVRVDARDRIERVESGAVDFECGSTTITAARGTRVAFSPVIFVTGTRIAVPRASRVRGVGDLAGRRVAVVGGTTNEAALRDIDRLRKLRLELVAVADYPEALGLLLSGGADALAADEAILRGVLAQRNAARDVRIVGPLFSFEPYGIALARGEPALADAAERALRDLAISREIQWIYDRWFVRPLPGRPSLDMPMSVQLRRSLELIGLPPD